MIPILTPSTEIIMKTFYIADGISYRNRRMSKVALSASDRYYLRKTTSFIDRVWVYFSKIEDDFRLLHMPM